MGVNLDLSVDYGCLTDCDILLGYEEVSIVTCWSGYRCVFNGKNERCFRSLGTLKILFSQTELYETGSLNVEATPNFGSAYQRSYNTPTLERGGRDPRRGVVIIQPLVNLFIS